MTSDPLAALAHDPGVVTARDAEKAAVQHLQTLLEEQAAAQTRYKTLPATPATRAQRLKLLDLGLLLEREIEAGQHEVAVKHRAVVRAQRSVAEKGSWQLSEKAKASGATILEKISDLLGDFQELRADHESGQTIRAVVVQADRDLSEETPAAPSVKFASGLGEGIWDALLRLTEVALSEQARRQRVSITGTVVTAE